MRASRLVVEGGEPAVRPGMHRAWPEITQADRDAVMSVLEAPAEDLGGPHSRFARELEERVAAFCGVRFCRALASGTDALWAGLVAAGVGPGDRVIVPAVSYVATAMAVVFAGGEIDWCDVEAESGNLDVGQAERLVGARTRAIVPVHAHGLMADMAALREVAGRHGLAVVEDAAQAAGASQHGELAGAIGLCGAFSLNVKKPLQGGDGGLVVTDDEAVQEAVVSASTFGEGGARPGPGQTSAHFARWLGRNSRIHPMAAALATAQLRRLPGLLARAEENAAILREGLAELPGVLAPGVPAGSTSTNHLVRVRLDAAALGWEGPLRELRDRFMHALRGEGVEVGTWQLEPLPRMSAFRRGEPTLWAPGAEAGALSAWEPARYPEACRLLDGSVVLGRVPYPLHVQTGELMRAYVVAFRKVVEGLPAVLAGPYEPLAVYPRIADAEL